MYVFADRGMFFNFTYILIIILFLSVIHLYHAVQKYWNKRQIVLLRFQSWNSTSKQKPHRRLGTMLSSS